MRVGLPGTVYLVGAGPGDPGLLTVRGAELLERAGAVLHEARIAPELLAQIDAGADLSLELEVPGSSAPAAAARLADLLKRHEIVVCLMAGDPLSSRRGRELARALAEANVRFEVVPGVFPATAVPAYVGIPVNVGESGGAIFLLDRAASDDAGDDGSIGLSLDRDEATLIATGPVLRLKTYVEGALRDAYDSGVPAAVVVAGTTVRQRTFTAPVGQISSVLGEVEGGEEAVLVVGEPVRRRQKLAWFETRPLFGRRVVVTRPRSQAAAMVAAIEDLGGEVIQFPTIRIRQANDPEPLRQAARDVDRFDWVVFTSVNGVAHFWSALRESGRDSRSLAGVSLCAIGPATAAALEMEGVRADLVPERFVAESVVEALAAETDLRGTRILLPRADLARETLPQGLRALGADVVDVVAYQTSPDAAESDSLRNRLQAGSVDVITFTSSSTVQNFVDLVGTSLGRARVASIGPVTSATARKLGLSVDVEADEYTVPGLIRAILKHLGDERSNQG